MSNQPAPAPKELTDFLNRILQLQNFPSPVDVHLQLEVLAHVLERLKHEVRFKSGRLDFDDFIRCKVFVDSDKIVVAAPTEEVSATLPVAPIQFQIPLLLFLLLNHRDRFHIIEIIERFIDKLWDQLTLADFKKTKTGVVRCYTNTRFAASTLRKYGLLKFTAREAFKTWELSLMGFVVAANVANPQKANHNPWRIPDYEPSFNFDLMPEIRNAWSGSQKYEDFVAHLSRICVPNAEVFDTFDKALQNAHRLLNKYWAIICDHQLTQTERQKLSLETLHELERTGISDEFYTEFSSCIAIEDLIKRVSKPNPPDDPQVKLL